MRHPPPRRAARPNPRHSAIPQDAGRPEAAPRDGALWLHGLHPVAAALANPARRLKRLLVTEEAEAALTARLPQPWRILPERAERARFGTFLPEDSVHQGAALLAEPLPNLPLDRALAHNDGPVLVLDQVTDPRNIGAIMRSAAAFGAAALVMQDRHAPPETGALARAASGALEIVPVVRVVNLSRTLESLKKAGLWVVGLDGEAPTTLAQAGLTGRRVALVLGAEGEGMRRLTRENCDELARLPIAPEMESLNVSAAAAVALYELGRR
jgi:23S rRNA (guanosine2251-2'-O)-methyltransferase